MKVSVRGIHSFIDRKMPIVAIIASMVYLFVPSNIESLFDGLPITSVAELAALSILIFLILREIFISNYQNQINRMTNTILKGIVGILIVMAVVKLYYPTSNGFDLCFTSAEEEATCQSGTYNYTPHIQFGENGKEPFRIRQLNTLHFNISNCTDQICVNRYGFRKNENHPFIAEFNLPATAIKNKQLTGSYNGQLKVEMFSATGQVLLEYTKPFTREFNELSVPVDQQVEKIRIFYKNYRCGTDWEDAPICLKNMNHDSIKLKDATLLVETIKSVSTVTAEQLIFVGESIIIIGPLVFIISIFLNNLLIFLQSQFRLFDRKTINFQITLLIVLLAWIYLVSGQWLNLYMIMLGIACIVFSFIILSPIQLHRENSGTIFDVLVGLPLAGMLLGGYFGGYFFEAFDLQNDQQLLKTGNEYLRYSSWAIDLINLGQVFYYNPTVILSEPYYVQMRAIYYLIFGDGARSLMIFQELWMSTLPFIFLFSMVVLFNRTKWRKNFHQYKTNIYVLFISMGTMWLAWWGYRLGEFSTGISEWDSWLWGLMSLVMFIYGCLANEKYRGNKFFTYSCVFMVASLLMRTNHIVIFIILPVFSLLFINKSEFWSYTKKFCLGLFICALAIGANIFASDAVNMDEIVNYVGANTPEVKLSLAWLTAGISRLVFDKWVVLIFFAFSALVLVRAWKIDKRYAALLVLAVFITNFIIAQIPMAATGYYPLTLILPSFFICILVITTFPSVLGVDVDLNQESIQSKKKPVYTIKAVHSLTSKAQKPQRRRSRR